MVRADGFFIFRFDFLNSCEKITANIHLPGNKDNTYYLNPVSSNTENLKVSDVDKSENINQHKKGILTENRLFEDFRK